MFSSNPADKTASIYPAGKLIYTVSQLTQEIKIILEDVFADIWVEGEISNFIFHSSGHIYFDLKDAASVIHCVFFRNANHGMKFEMANGLKAVCHGKISVYDKKGQYQLYVDRVEPKGVGRLQLAFEQLKERLCKEGLFDQARKSPVPVFPSKIGVVTSPTGAAIRDILHVLNRRFSNLEILIYPVKVQGEEAASEIAEAIKDFNRMTNAEVLILARGGGSLEDLWAFNEEAVARAIYESEIPIISAVGHETDYTIADFVADLRAPTPSAAAELVISRKEDFREKIEVLSKGLKNSLNAIVLTFHNQLSDLIENRVFRCPMDVIERHEQRLDDLAGLAGKGVLHLMDINSGRFNVLAGQLDALSPLAILGRGYSVTLRFPERTVIKDAADLKQGDVIETRLSKGRLLSEVKEALKES
ncbi:MAG: exodeoxyribonuclease VII large subunit [Candidatus Omnitrophota bacterium]